MDWFLYDNGLCHERVKLYIQTDSLKLFLRKDFAFRKKMKTIISDCSKISARVSIFVNEKAKRSAREK